MGVFLYQWPVVFLRVGCLPRIGGFGLLITTTRTTSAMLTRMATRTTTTRGIQMGSPRLLIILCRTFIRHTEKGETLPSF